MRVYERNAVVRLGRPTDRPLSTPSPRRAVRGPGDCTHRAPGVAATSGPTGGDRDAGLLVARGRSARHCATSSPPVPRSLYGGSHGTHRTPGHLQVHCVGSRRLQRFLPVPRWRPRPAHAPARRPVRRSVRASGHRHRHRDPKPALSNGTEFGYGRLLSTLPLDRAVAFARVHVDEASDPYTSVLVVNLGGERGAACPDCHWQYEPDSPAGFHRIGFYSNVDDDFLPANRRDGSHTSMYVERAFPGGRTPTDTEVSSYTRAVIRELAIGGTSRASTWCIRAGWKSRTRGALAAVDVARVGAGCPRRRRHHPGRPLRPVALPGHRRVHSGRLRRRSGGMSRRPLLGARRGSVVVDAQLRRRRYTWCSSST